MSKAPRPFDPSLKLLYMANVPQNKIFIATSIDGYIADRKGKIDYLETIPELNTVDTGYKAFVSDIDALVMGRATYETVCGFDIPWPYTIPVYVLSSSLTPGSLKFDEQVTYLKGDPSEILTKVHQDGYHRLYIDGGSVIQSFLAKDLIDEMIITVIPVLLGGGSSLFGEHEKMLQFKCIETKHFLGTVSQNRFVRVS